MGKRKNAANSNSTSSSDYNTSLETTLPNLPLQFVEMRSQISQQDIDFIRSAMGYFPGNALRVAGRDPTTQNPTVLQSFPLVLRKKHNGKKLSDAGGKKRKSRKRGRDDSTEAGEEGNKDWAVLIGEEVYIVEPFPTTYWMLCPKLKADISKLEAAKATSVTAMEARLSIPTNEQARSDLIKAHGSTGRDRWRMLSPELKKEVTSRNWRSLFPDKGIGGMANFENGKVKCMHMHAADSIGLNKDLNSVGAWTLELVREMREGLRKEK